MSPPWLRLLLGPVGSALSTRWGARPVVMIGGLLTSLGFLCSAFAGSLLHLYLALGVLAGRGAILRSFRGGGGDRRLLGAGGQLCGGGGGCPSKSRAGIAEPSLLSFKHVTLFLIKHG